MEDTSQRKKVKLWKNFSRFHIELETSMKSSDFIIDCVHLLYYKCHKIYFKRWESYLDSSDWIKNKKATRKPINKKKKMLSMHCNSHYKYEEIKNNPQRTSKVKPFINKYK